MVDNEEEVADVPRDPVPVDVMPGLEFLKNYTYDQGRNIKKRDIIYYYDTDCQDFVRVQIVSKSNFKDYYNIKFLDSDRPKCGIYFKKGDFWSFSLPVLIEEVLPGGIQLHPPPPVELERRSRSQRGSRQVSPNQSAFRTDNVCVLPEDNLKDLLSPRSRRRARRLNLPPEQEYMRSSMARALTAKPGSSVPQSRVAGFLDKILLLKK